MKDFLFGAFWGALFGIVMLIAANAGAACAQDEVDWAWSPPTSGSAAVGYYVQWSNDLTNWTSVDTVAAAECCLVMPNTGEYYIRVIAFDAWSRPGTPSDPSDPYQDLGPPGKPGKPWVRSVGGALTLLLTGLVLGSLLGRKR